MTPQETISSMKQTGLIPVFYHANADVARGVVDTAYAAGVRVFEFTNRGDQAPAVFVQLLKHSEQYKDLQLGIGTVMDDETTTRFLDAGAHFIVSPILRPTMSAICRERSTLWIPGCATLTEIVTARDHGASLIKLFPGSVLGPAFVSAVMPVIPGLQLMPTGGVEPTRQNLSAWFHAGVTCVGMGSQLFSKELVENKQWTVLQTRIQQTLSIVQEVRPQ